MLSRLPKLVRRRTHMERLLGLRPTMLGAISFMAVILLGSCLLTTPMASAGRHWTNPIDALFTGTSAVCVTGLITLDTGGHWSLFGQIVILVLIQAGGLGIMTLSAFVAWVLGRRFSFRSEAALGTVLDEDFLGIARIVRYIVLMAFSVELVGALMLFGAWHDDPRFASMGQAAYHAVFHSISGFCNAGFSLYANNLEGFCGNVPINIIMMALIVIGGIGFPVIRNINGWLRGRNPTTGLREKIAVQTKMVLWVSLVLTVVGMALILAIESNGVLKDMPVRERITAAVFQAVTPRTAGFNSVPMGQIAPATTFLLCILMFIGASPGSTGGGVKTTTFGTMLFTLVATLRGRKRVEVYGHTINAMAVKRALCIAFLGMASVAVVYFLLLITEHFDPLDTLFEVVSAFGTVGLSRGITPHLSVVGKLLITLLMFVGRLGPLTLLLAIGGIEDRADYAYPEARLMIG